MVWTNPLKVALCCGVGLAALLAAWFVKSGMSTDEILQPFLVFGWSKDMAQAFDVAESIQNTEARLIRGKPDPVGVRGGTENRSKVQEVENPTKEIKLESKRKLETNYEKAATEFWDHTLGGRKLTSEQRVAADDEANAHSDRTLYYSHSPGRNRKLAEDDSVNKVSPIVLNNVMLPGNSLSSNVVRQGLDVLKDISSGAPTKQLPVYWINLDKSKERRSYMEEMFQSLQNNLGPVVSAVRVPATDKTGVFQMVSNGNFVHSGATLIEPSKGVDYGKGFYELHKGLKYSFTEAACLMSHLSAILKAYQDGHETVLIVEDDAVITEDFLLQWESYARRAPSDWKILQWVTCNGLLVQQGMKLEDPWISWMPDHYAARAYMLNVEGMRAILDATYSLSDGQVIWTAPEGMIVADEIVYHLAGNAYSSTHPWVGSSDLDSTIQQDRAHALALPMDVDERDSLARKTPKTRPESILVVSNVRISSVDEITDEILRLQADVEALCAYHTICDWAVNFVFTDSLLKSEFEREWAATMPSNVHLYLKVNANAFNKFEFVDEFVQQMKNYDYVLLKDNDQRIAGLPWITFMERKGSAVVSGVLREARKESYLMSRRIPRRQFWTFHDADLWKQRYTETWPRHIFNETQPFEVPFIEEYFTLMEGDFASWFFATVLSPTYTKQPCDWGLDMMWCAAAKQFRPSESACVMVPVVSLHDDTRQIQRAFDDETRRIETTAQNKAGRDWRSALQADTNSIQTKADEALLSQCQKAVDTFVENPVFAEWITYSRTWRAIIGDAHPWEIEERCGELFGFEPYEFTSASLEKCILKSIPTAPTPTPTPSTVPGCTLQDARTPLIVLSAPRTGSNLFMDMVESIGNVTGSEGLDFLNFWEAFNRDPELYGKNVGRLTRNIGKTCDKDESTSQEIAKQLMDERLVDPRAFLNHLTTTPSTSSNPFYAIKTFQFQLNDVTPWSFKEYVDEVLASYEMNKVGRNDIKRRPKFAVVWRRRMIESYVSFEIAKSKGQWVHSHTDENSAVLAKKEALENYIRRNREWFEEVRDVLNAANIDFEVFEYERDLTTKEGKMEVIQRMAPVLELNGEINAEQVLGMVRVAKQAQVPLEKQIQNWHEVLEWGYGGDLNDWPDLFA